MSYSLPELMGEKLRALAERCRPRDLYDVIHMHRHPDLVGFEHEVRAVLDAKCAHAGITIPTLESMRANVFRTEVEAEWGNMLGHQLPFLPPFEGFWSELDEVFAWLGGRTAAPVLEPVPVPRDIAPWQPARHMTTWRYGAPLEVIRFAGANRLKVVLDYWPERGRVGPRVVEPYSLRRTLDGNLLLFVRNDHGQLRSYRIDRIRGARIEPESFTPRYRIDF
jgi:Nucleotidyl transferase AbiEii toxin, Type IV TA system/WYL domain